MLSSISKSRKAFQVSSGFATELLLIDNKQKYPNISTTTSNEFLSENMSNKQMKCVFNVIVFKKPIYGAYLLNDKQLKKKRLKIQFIKLNKIKPQLNIEE